MIRHTALRKIIGADSFAAIPGTNLIFPGLGYFRLLVDKSLIQETCPKHFQSLGLVFMLGFFILAADHQAGGEVGNTDCRIGGVHTLAAGAGGTKNIDFKIVLIYLHLHIFSLRQHRNSDCRSMNPSLGFGGRDALDPMDSAFVFQITIHLLPLNESDYLFKTS